MNYTDNFQMPHEDEARLAVTCCPFYMFWVQFANTLLRIFKCVFTRDSGLQCSFFIMSLPSFTSGLCWPHKNELGNALYSSIAEKNCGNLFLPLMFDKTDKENHLGPKVSFESKIFLITNSVFNRYRDIQVFHFFLG